MVRRKRVMPRGKVEADVYGGELAVKLSVPVTERMALLPA